MSLEKSCVRFNIFPEILSTHYDSKVSSICDWLDSRRKSLEIKAF